MGDLHAIPAWGPCPPQGSRVRMCEWCHTPAPPDVHHRTVPVTPAGGGDGEESSVTAMRIRPPRWSTPYPGPARPHLPQQPDLVQLLTPEGERVEHPDYAARHHRRGAARPLPRPRAGPPVGRRGHRAAAPGRAGHLGLAARPGGRPGRRRPRAAGRRHGLPDLPRARRRLDPRGRPAARDEPVPRRRQRRLGPGRAPASTSTRSSSARSACTRPATPWACSATARRAPSWPSSATARPARARSTRR